MKKVIILMLLCGFCTSSCNQKKNIPEAEANNTEKSELTEEDTVLPYIVPVPEVNKFEIDGISCTPVEEGEFFIRLSTSKKLSVEQIKRVKKEFDILQNTIQFCMPNKTERGQEYASIDKLIIGLYDENKIIDLKTNKTIEFN